MRTKVVKKNADDPRWAQTFRFKFPTLHECVQARWTMTVDWSRFGSDNLIGATARPRR